MRKTALRRQALTGIPRKALRSSEPHTRPVIWSFAQHRKSTPSTSVPAVTVDQDVSQNDAGTPACLAGASSRRKPPWLGR